MFVMTPKQMAEENAVAKTRDIMLAIKRLEEFVKLDGSLNMLLGDSRAIIVLSKAWYMLRQGAEEQSAVREILSTLGMLTCGGVAPAQAVDFAHRVMDDYRKVKDELAAIKGGAA